MKSILTFLAILVFSFFTITRALAQSEDLNLIATDGSTVTIQRDSFGVPHISSETEAGVFFGQGFAVAQDRLFQLESLRRASEGKLTAWLGTSFLEGDMAIRTLFYTQEERMQTFTDLPAELKTMLESYRDGVNTYLDSMAANPAKFKPLEFQIFFEMERWTVYKSIAITQFLTRRFGQDGGEELERLLELQTNGQQWFDENRPINDPTAPTTIHATSGSAASKSFSYSGMRVRDEVVESIKAKRQAIDARLAEIGVPLKFGSFAVLISQAKSNNGQVKLLGAPQMGEPQANATNITHEVELNSPTLHVGGMTVAGIPAVIIGHNDHHAWTLTSGNTDNTDIYIETTVDNSFSKYLHNGQVDFVVIDETIKTATGEIPFTHYRTVHGPVIADDLANKQVFSMKMTFWNQELDMLKAFYEAAKATSLEEFEAAAAMVPVSFNLFYAGQDQVIKFWHIGKYVDRSQETVDPRLPHNGDGSEEWSGFIAFADLPSADFTQQDYFVNWNNKPVDWWNNGDNIAWAQTPDRTNPGDRTTRVLFIEAFVGPIQGFTYDNLKDVPRQITSHGTYQQAIEFTGTEIIDENIIPPGQSGFVNINAVSSPHFSDQWDLHINWQFKDMIFAEDIVSSVNSNEPVPQGFTLHQNYPNPFNPGTTISYDLPRPGRVLLEIYNIHGQLVETLVDEFQEAGTRTVAWDASGFSSGVYLYRIAVGERAVVKKAILLK